MQPRDFITLLGGAAAAWPVVAPAQQDGRVRRIGVLMGAANDAEEQTHLAAFRQGLQHLGWTDGGNVRIDDRWAAGESDRINDYARELVGLKPDVLFVNSFRSLRAAQAQTRNIPIVFVTLSDHVRAARAAGSHPHLALVAARAEKREYSRQFGSHPGNPG
jgi:putative tryptophan/tyrosine transport system substrate-binding protein